MQLTAYFQLLRRWFWLIALATVLAGAASFSVARSQTPLYQTTATVQIGIFQELPNPDRGLIATAQGLAETYFVLAKTFPFLEAVIARLQIPSTPEELALMFEMAIIPGTPFFTVTASHPDPIIATRIANSVANELIARRPASITEERQRQIASLKTEIERLLAQLEKDNQELTAIELRLRTPDSNAAILTVRQNELYTRIAEQQATLAQLSSNLIALQSQGEVNVLSLVEPARIPQRSLAPPVVRDTVLAALVGGVLAVAIVALIEQLNTTIKSADEIVPLLNVPVIGIVPPFGRKGIYRGRLITWKKPRSPVAEAFRALRVNLIYHEKDTYGFRDSSRVYIVTSSVPREGKSVVAANLAATFAMAGRRVALIDADTRRPSLHRIFKLPNTKGLSTILQHEELGEQVIEVPEGDPSMDDAFFRNHGNGHERKVVTVESPTKMVFYTIPDDLPMQKTAVPRLEVITSGPSLVSPTELLDTPRTRELVHHLIHDRGFEVVILDTPPALNVSDSSVLASLLDAPVILVVESGRTLRASALASIRRFSLLSVPVIGVVFNRAKPRDVESGYANIPAEIAKATAPTLTRKQATSETLMITPPQDDLE